MRLIGDEIENRVRDIVYVEVWVWRYLVYIIWKARYRAIVRVFKILEDGFRLLVRRTFEILR